MSQAGDPTPVARCRWLLALLGQFLFVFAAVALSGPGRLDIDDGQARFEVAQSIVDHGDPAIRDPEIWYTVLPGRYGMRYTNYRLPHSALGAAAIILADYTGRVTEGRRHFFFALIGAVAAAALAVTYSCLFRFFGLSPIASVLWATAGVFCTPSWYYGTSTFDDLLCALFLVATVAVALAARQQRALLGAAVAGVLLGITFNCKPPLGIFVLPVLAALYDPATPWRRQLPRAALVVAGLLLGVAGQLAYEMYKFPAETLGARNAILKQWEPIWTWNPIPGLASLLGSPGAGAIWYCPPLLLGVVGLCAWWRIRPAFSGALAVSSVVFVVFICFLTFFKGDMAWGPRYLTPIFAVFWILVPAGAQCLRRRYVAAVLIAGLVVQVLGLSVDPHRLYLKRNLWSRFYVVDPWIYFDPAVSHLANRPREVAEIMATQHEEAQQFTPSSAPTRCLPILERTPHGLGAITYYYVLNSFRPWWLSQQYLGPAQRPVDLPRTFALLCATLGIGLALSSMALRPVRASERMLTARSVSDRVPTDRPEPMESGLCRRSSLALPATAHPQSTAAPASAGSTDR